MKSERKLKTHYVTLRVIFDKPCDKRTALRSARYGLTRDRAIPARGFHTKYFFDEPMTFTVARVMSDARSK